VKNKSAIGAIAKAAGVSTATVDRVINERPGVSPETVRKVREAMEAGGMGAPKLGRPKKENFRFAFVLPAARTPFFDMVDRVIAKSASDFRHRHITELAYRFDASDPERFADGLAGLKGCNGVAVLAPDQPQIKLAINALVQSGVHVVTMISDVAGTGRAAYIGSDNRAAGRTAALLSGRIVGSKRPARLVLTSQKGNRLSAEIDRRVGFAQLLEERYPNIELLRIPDLPEGEEAMTAAIAAILADEAGGVPIAGFYNVGAGTSAILRAVMAKLKDPDLVTVAHDFTDKNAALLSKGKLSFVLNEDIRLNILTAARALLALCENQRGVPFFVPPRVEIITSENISSSFEPPMLAEDDGP
jgi:LacI family transcriptional regulator